MSVLKLSFDVMRSTGRVVKILANRHYLPNYYLMLHFLKSNVISSLSCQLVETLEGQNTDFFTADFAIQLNSPLDPMLHLLMLRGSNRWLHAAYQWLM